MRFWRRSLQQMLDEFASAGFRLTSITEPQPLTEARDLHPEDFLRVTTSPCFLFFALEAVQSSDHLRHVGHFGIPRPFQVSTRPTTHRTDANRP